MQKSINGTMTIEIKGYKLMFPPRIYNCTLNTNVLSVSGRDVGVDCDLKEVKKQKKS